MGTLFRIQNQLRLLVATEDGMVYVYNFDSKEGGDLVLYKQHRLDGNDDITKGITQTDGQPKRSEPQNIEEGNQTLLFFFCFCHFVL